MLNTVLVLIMKGMEKDPVVVCIYSCEPIWENVDSEAGDTRGVQKGKDSESSRKEDFVVLDVGDNSRNIMSGNDLHLCRICMLCLATLFVIAPALIILN